MKHKAKDWTKAELQVYILLMCANADNEETKEEVHMIKSKVDAATFNKMEQLFHKDSERRRLKKIDISIHRHTYSSIELAAFRNEAYDIFLSDNSFTMMEKRLDWTLDNILY